MRCTEGIARDVRPDAETVQLHGDSTGPDRAEVADTLLARRELPWPVAQVERVAQAVVDKPASPPTCQLGVPAVVEALIVRLNLKSGRGDWIRTSDPLRPRQVRYQAALRPD